MSLKDLQHDGGEDFDELKVKSWRAKKLAAEGNNLVADPSEFGEGADLEKQQEEYMSFDNPLLWDGEI